MSTTTAESTRLIALNNVAVARAAGMVLTAGGMTVARTHRAGVVLLAIVLATLLAISLAKVTLIVVVGETAYSAGIAAMRAGTVFDQAAAWLMSVDGVAAALLAHLK